MANVWQPYDFDAASFICARIKRDGGDREEAKEALRQEFGENMTNSNRSEMLAKWFGRTRKNRTYTVAAFRRDMGLVVGVRSVMEYSSAPAPSTAATYRPQVAPEPVPQAAPGPEATEEIYPALDDPVHRTAVPAKSCLRQKRLCGTAAVPGKRVCFDPQAVQKPAKPIGVATRLSVPTWEKAALSTEPETAADLGFFVTEKGAWFRMPGWQP